MVVLRTERTTAARRVMITAHRGPPSAAGDDPRRCHRPPALARAKRTRNRPNGDPAFADDVFRKISSRHGLTPRPGGRSGAPIGKLRSEPIWGPHETVAGLSQPGRVGRDPAVTPPAEVAWRNEA